MKKFVVVFILFLCTSCGTKSAPFKAIYLTHSPGELSSQDLQTHPEVMVVSTFEELKKNSHQKVALWIDKSATPLDSAQEEWINKPPQTYYPIVFIGTSDTLYAFKNSLGLCCFLGPTGIYPGMNAPGFSVILRKPPADANTAPVDVPFIHGYDQKLTVQSILEITNDLLEGKINPTPISTLPKAPLEIPTSSIHQIILFDKEPKNSFPNDAAKINIVYLPIQNNLLTMDVAYKGNCQQHAFELYTQTVAVQSNPPQVILFLSHDSHGDTCTEDVEQELSFDVTPLEKQRTKSNADHLLLHLYEPAGNSFATEPMTLEWP